MLASLSPLWRPSSISTCGLWALGASEPQSSSCAAVADRALLIILALYLAAMAYSDYDADATELLETYGKLPGYGQRGHCTYHELADFLMKFIIIGG